MTDPRFGKSSASNLHLVVACPGFLNLWNELKGQSVFPPPQSADALWGQQVHAAWAGNLSEMSLSERQQVVKKKADSIEAKLVNELFGDEPTQVFVETRFMLSDPKTGEIVHSAQIDKAHVRDGKVLLMDLKSLYSDTPPAEENYQLLSQSVCIYDDSTTRNQIGLKDVTEIVACIIQPLRTLKPTLVRYLKDDLRRAKSLIFQKLDEAAAPNAPRIPGNHCRLCPNSTHCDVSAYDMLAVIPKTCLGVSHVPPELLAAMMPHFGAIERRLKDLKERAKALAEEGLLPGYTLKEVQGDRYLPDIQAARDLFKDWVSKEEVLSMLRLPLTKLREKFVDKYSAEKSVTKVEAGEKFDELVEGICQRERPSKRLVKSQ